MKPINLILILLIIESISIGFIGYLSNLTQFPPTTYFYYTTSILLLITFILLVLKNKIGFYLGLIASTATLLAGLSIFLFILGLIFESLLVYGLKLTTGLAIFLINEFFITIFFIIPSIVLLRSLYKNKTKLEINYEPQTKNH